MSITTGLRKNRLHITYNASTRTRFIFDGLKESFRCTNIKRAAQIVGMRNPSIIKEATFRDADGQFYQIA